MTATKNDWKETKTKIKAKFGKLSDPEIEGLNGHMDDLSNRIQKVYGYDKAKADQESNSFKESLKKS